MKKNFFKLFYKYWMKFALILGTINGYIILTLIYFVVLGIYGIFYQIIKALRRLFRKETEPQTFWKQKEIQEVTLEKVRYQF